MYGNSNNNGKVSLPQRKDDGAIFDGKEGKTKVFVPKSKLIIKDDAVSEDYNLCIMPKWEFFNTQNLAQNVECIGETQHMEIVNDIED